MANRYTYRRLFENRLKMYIEQRKARSVRTIKHFSSPNFSYPKGQQINDLVLIDHVWKLGDRYYKLAHKHYGDAQLWWLIAWFNMAPTESHLQTGQRIKIPTPLGTALSYMRDRY